MKRNSIIEPNKDYVSPFVAVITFVPEGILCESELGSGGGVYEPDDDLPGIDF